MAGNPGRADLPPEPHNACIHMGGTSCLCRALDSRLIQHAEQVRRATWGVLDLVVVGSLVARILDDDLRAQALGLVDE